MTRKIKFTKQHKPIGFVDSPDLGTVGGHRIAMAQAADTRAYNRRIKELAAEDEARHEGILSRLVNYVRLKLGRY
jgi:hypothetical protein